MKNQKYGEKKGLTFISTVQSKKFGAEHLYVSTALIIECQEYVDGMKKRCW